MSGRETDGLVAAFEDIDTLRECLNAAENHNTQLLKDKEELATALTVIHICASFHYGLGSDAHEGNAATDLVTLVLDTAYAALQPKEDKT